VSDASVSVAGGLLVIAAFAVYANSLSGPFIFDDVLSIPQNPTIRHLGSALFPPGGGLTVSGRPLLNLSFALNHALSGDEVWSYHALNLLIHLLAGLVLFGIVRRTLVWMEGKGQGVTGKGSTDQVLIAGRHRRMPPEGNVAGFGEPALQVQSTLLAFAAAMLWMLHPLQTESVTYVVQRSESLMGLFYLLTLYCFIRGAEGQERGAVEAPAAPGRRNRWVGAGWFALSSAACVGGMATKEVMVSAPVLVLLYDRCFVAGSFRAAWRRRWRVHLALAGTWTLLAALVVSAGNRGGTAGFDISVGIWEYVATQFQAVSHYLRLSILPHPLILDYGAEWVSHARDVVPYLPVAVLLIAGTAFALWRRPALGFLGAWFLAILAPTSLVPNARQTLAEHRMYLALAPVAVLLVLALHRWLGRRAWGVLLAAVVGLGWMTVRRNLDYRSALAVWSDTVAKRPANAGAHVNLGNALEARGQLGEALTEFETAVRLDPTHATAFYDAGGACLRLQRFPEATTYYRRALALHLDFPEVHTNLGEALVRAGRPADAVHEFETALRMMPGSAEGEYRLGNALAQAGQTAAAMGHLEAALRLRPDYAQAHNNLGNLLQQGGDTAAAIAHYEAAVREDPLFAIAHDNLGNALLRLGRLQEARAQFELVLRLQPNSPAPAYNLGTIDLHFGRLDEARGEFERVLALDPGNSNAHNNLGNILAESGQTAAALDQYHAALRGDPANAAAHYNLGRLWLQLGRRTEARAEFEAALRLSPEFDGARVGLEQIDGGQ